MRRPRQNKLIFKIFSWYISRIIGSDFKKFEFNDIKLDPRKSVLLLANHMSWWDGFLMFYLNKIFFKRQFHIMINEETYDRIWFLRYMGSFSVKRNSRSILESLEFAGKLLDEPENLVLIFPQGLLYSGHVREVEFQKGLIRLIASSSRKFQYVFAAMFADYFEHRKPGINCYLEAWEGSEYVSLQLLKNAYNKHYELSRQKQSKIII